MGNYLNPGNSGFARIRNDIYVDKSGLIGCINQTIDTSRCLTCISRPRRFGKSFAAQMLCAYYDRTCDSSGLFDDLGIASDKHYQKYLNQYDVIYLDMTGIIGEASGWDIVPYIQRNITQELMECYKGLKAVEGFAATLANAAEMAGNKFIMIIDEWDAPIREAAGNQDLQRKYLEFLRTLFKNSGMTSKIFAAAYMTGILPIKKDGSQSVMSDFEEFTMVKPRRFGKYVGFTEDEVRKLCHDSGSDFPKMKKWYDGYSFRDAASVYNPNSVMKAIRNDDFDSYWTQTSAAESLMGYIGLDFDGMGKTVSELIGGVEAKVDTRGFANDLVTFQDRDDVLTLLIHLGYLAYDEMTQKVRIPNEEIRQEFARSIRKVNRDELSQNRQYMAGKCNDRGGRKTMKKVGIIGAMAQEVERLKGKMEVRRTISKASMEFWEGSLNGTEAVVVQSGIGKVNAALCAQILCDLFAVTHIINTGVAGSLKNEINIGDIVVSTDALHHDMDARVLGVRLGEVPQAGCLAFPADSHLQQLAVSICKETNPTHAVYQGRVVSGDQFISDRQLKAKIIENFQGFCVEMEGAPIAQAAYQNHIPFVIIRAISDKADDSAEMDFPVFEKEAAAHSAALVEHMLPLI